VTITGTNLANATVVDFGTTSVTSFTSDTVAQIIVMSPAGTGTVDVTVKTADGTSAISLADQYRFVPAPALLTSLSAVSGSGTFGGTATLTSTLTVASLPLSGETVTFTLNEGGAITIVGTATTNAAGVATLTGVSLTGLNAGTYSGALGVRFGGDSTYAGSSASGSLDVNPGQATLTLSGLTFTYDGTPHAATVNTDPEGLTGVTVTYSQNGVAVPAPTQAGSYSVSASLNNPNYTATIVTGTLVINAATPLFVIREQPLFNRKTNKKGKPIGSPVLSGYLFDFSDALNSSSATNSANYQVDTITTKRVKKQTQRSLHPITNFSVSYSASSDSVTLTFAGKQSFPTGGQITVLSGPSGGVITASGVTLSENTVFSISSGGRNIIAE
jgi:hypothetical protein